MVLQVGEVSKEVIFDYGRNYMIIFAFKKLFRLTALDRGPERM